MKKNLIQVDLENLTSKIKEIKLSSYIGLNCIEMKEANTIILGPKGVVQYFYLFSGDNINNIKTNIITEESYFGCIKITENIFAMISNIIFPKGKDKLFFFNFNTKKLSNEIVIHLFYRLMAWL